MTNLEIILSIVVALQGFSSVRIEMFGRQVKRSLLPPPQDTNNDEKPAQKLR